MKHLRQYCSVFVVSFAAILVATPIAISLSGCQTVPVTGRKRLPMLTSEAKENALGSQAYQQILAEEKLSTNADATAMVKRVGQRIAAVAGRDDFDWQFELIASPTKNAFCLPGGKVAIYEGILPVCGNEAGLAVVMSHEIGHALARHGGERMNQQTLVSAGKVFGSKVLDQFGGEGGLDEKTRQRVAVAYGATTKYGVVLPFSRKHESEADAIGLQLMSKAGYDPSEALHFWDRFAQANGPKPPAFFSTHPSDARRAVDLREQLPDALAVYNQAVEQHGLGDAIPEIRLASHDEPGQATQ